MNAPSQGQFASREGFIGTLGTDVSPGQRPVAALAYGESPLAAAADGWVVRYVSDTATSLKHPAQFAVLTKTVERVAHRGTSGSFGSYPSVAAMCSGVGSIVVGFDTEWADAQAFDAERP